MNNMQVLYSILFTSEVKLIYILLPLAHIPTPSQRSIQTGYTLQSATNNLCTITLCEYCQVLTYG